MNPLPVRRVRRRARGRGGRRRGCEGGGRSHGGFGVEWLDEYPSKLNALTLREVNGAIKKHLDPEKMVTIKAGTVSDAPKKPSGHP